MISLIIPFYNCEEQARQTLNTVKKYLDVHSDTEAVAVDDGSTDNTYEVLKGFVCDNISVVGYKTNKGKGGAIQAGVVAARGDKIIFTDADLAYGLDPINEIAVALNSSDMIVGSRREDKDIARRYGTLRSLSSKAFSFICDKVLKLGLKDTQCGIKGFRKDVAKNLFGELTVLRFGFDLDILSMARQDGYSVKSIPVTLIKNSPASKVNVLRDGFSMLGDILTIKSKLRKRKAKK